LIYLKENNIPFYLLPSREPKKPCINVGIKMNKNNRKYMLLVDAYHAGSKSFVPADLDKLKEKIDFLCEISGIRAAFSGLIDTRNEKDRARLFELHNALGLQGDALWFSK